MRRVPFYETLYPTLLGILHIQLYMRTKQIDDLKDELNYGKIKELIDESGECVELYNILKIEVVGFCVNKFTDIQMNEHFERIYKINILDEKGNESYCYVDVLDDRITDNGRIVSDVSSYSSQSDNSLVDNYNMDVDIVYKENMSYMANCDFMDVSSILYSVENWQSKLLVNQI